MFLLHLRYATLIVRDSLGQVEQGLFSVKSMDKAFWTADRWTPLGVEHVAIFTNFKLDPDGEVHKVVIGLTRAAEEA